MQALDVYQAARELGLRIPHDLSVVGFDDVPAVAWMDPTLTSVHQPLAEMATVATEPALAFGRGEEVPQVGMEVARRIPLDGPGRGHAGLRPFPGSPVGAVRDAARGGQGAGVRRTGLSGQSGRVTVTPVPEGARREPTTHRAP
ncbi:substrate-binding domain-containing protein [Streptomyces sp. NPDC052236]|uniref:substrate-binding domain-containing protein n=1 Tax=Streptomyces sp. NPDC052236 TaxID=3365686 RepID=UPI0037D0E8C6